MATPVPTLPGIYFTAPPAPAPAPAALPALDLVGFVGFTERGPLHFPVPVEDIETYRDIFGGDLLLARDARGNPERAHLPPSVAAFFANGGQRCRVVRVAGPGARATHVTLPGVVALEGGPGPAETARPVPLAASAPGSWGDDLHLATRLQALPLPSDSCTFLPTSPGGHLLQWHAGLDPETLQVGDLLELGFDTGPDYWLTVDRVHRSDAATGVVILESGVPRALYHEPPAAPPHRIRRLDDATPLAGNAAWQPASPGIGLALSAADPRPLYALAPGDILEVELEDGRRLLLAVSQVLPGGDGSPPAGGVEVRAERLMDLVPADSVSVSPPSRPTRIQRLRFEMRVRLGDEQHPALTDLGLNTGHPRFFGSAPTATADLDTDPSRQGRRTALWRKLLQPKPGIVDGNGSPEFARIDPARDGIPDTALMSGLLAPLDDPSQPTVYLPLGMSPQPGPEGRVTLPGDDDLSRFDAAAATLFLDPEAAPLPANPSAFASPRALPGLAFDRHYRRGLRLRGLHALYYDEAVALLSLPDAVHPSWAPGPNPEPEEPEPTPPPAAPGPPHGFDTCPAAPLITGTDPTKGSLEGGFMVRVGGRGFVADATRVRFGARPATVVRVLSGTELECRVPPGNAPGPVAVEVETDFGSDLLQAGFRYTETAQRPALPLLATADAGDPEDGPLPALHQSMLVLSLARTDLVALLSLPAVFDQRRCLAWQEALRARLAAISAGDDFGVGPDLSYGAVFHPWPLLREADGNLAPLPPDGPVAALVADRELRRGVWVAPANQPLRGVLGLSVPFDDPTRAELTAAGFNLLASGPRGFRIATAHTLAAGRGPLQLSVRRLLILLRKAVLERGLDQVFAPDSETGRGALRLTLEALLTDLYARGAFAGAGPAAAFRIELAALAEEREGHLTVRLRVAPSRPLEFIAIALTRTGSGLLQAAEV
jgi:hypothetical protein